MAALGERYNTCSQRCTSNPSSPWLLAGTSISLLTSCISLQLSIPPITACSGAWKQNSVLTLPGSETSRAPVGSDFGSDCCYLRPFFSYFHPNQTFQLYFVFLLFTCPVLLANNHLGFPCTWPFLRPCPLPGTLVLSFLLISLPRLGHDHRAPRLKAPLPSRSHSI